MDNCVKISDVFNHITTNLINIQYLHKLAQTCKTINIICEQYLIQKAHLSKYVTIDLDTIKLFIKNFNRKIYCNKKQLNQLIIETRKYYFVKFHCYRMRDFLINVKNYIIANSRLDIYHELERQLKGYFYYNINYVQNLYIATRYSNYNT